MSTANADTKKEKGDDHWLKVLIRSPVHPHQFPSPSVTNFIIAIVLQSCLHYIDSMDQSAVSYVRYKRRLASSGELERGTRARRRHEREKQRAASTTTTASAAAASVPAVVVDSKKPEGVRRSARLSATASSTPTTETASQPPPPATKKKGVVELTVGDETIVTDIEEPAPPTKEEEEMMQKMEALAIEEDKKKEEEHKKFTAEHDDFPNVTDTNAANRFHSKFSCLKTGGTTVKWPPWAVRPWHKRLCELAKICKFTGESLRNQNNDDDDDSQRLIPALMHYYDGHTGARCEMTCVDPEIYKSCKEWTSDQWLAVLWSIFTKIIRLGNISFGGVVTDPSQKHIDTNFQFELGRAILEIGGPHSNPADTMRRLFELALYKFEEASGAQFNEKGQPLLRLHVSSRVAASPVEWRSYVYQIAELVETMPPALKAAPKDQKQSEQQQWRRFVVFMSSSLLRGLGATTDHFICTSLRWSYFDVWRFIGPMNMPRHIKERLFVFAQSGIQCVHYDALTKDENAMRAEVIGMNNKMQYYDQLLKTERETEIRHVIGLTLLSQINNNNNNNNNNRATKTSEVLNRVLNLINEYSHMDYASQRWPTLKSLCEEAKRYKVQMSRLLHEWSSDPFTVKFNCQFNPHSPKILAEVKNLNNQIEKFNIQFLASHNISVEDQPLKITDDPTAPRPLALRNTKTGEDIVINSDFAETLMGGRTYDSQYNNNNAPQVPNPSSPPPPPSSAAVAPASTSSASSASSSMMDV